MIAPLLKDAALLADIKAASRDDGPVSYTHLDVYKRQFLNLQHM